MSNFNYNNYIGEHMSEPLKIRNEGKFNPMDETYDFNICGYQNYEGCESVILDTILSRAHSNVRNCIPYLKSISDLTDDEWLFVFTGQEFDDDNVFELFINNKEVALCSQGLKVSGFDLSINKFDYSDQQILNRLYSLHVSLDYEELIKNNQAVRKG